LAHNSKGDLRLGSVSQSSGLPRRAILRGCAAAALFGPARTVLAQSLEVLTFDALYKHFGVLGLQFSDRVTASAGKRVRLTGFMAPPLKAESHFFVLTRQPLAICPFCQSDADWPVDIVVIYLKSASALVSAGRRITVAGTLEIGSKTDADTGFVSQIRLVDADFAIA
jgi:hypothetical protein